MEYNYSKEKRFGLTPKLNSLMEKISDDSVLTPEDLSEYMGVSVRQIRRYCEQGKITSYCFGRKYIVYGNDFKDYMRKSQVRPVQVRERMQ